MFPHLLPPPAPYPPPPHVAGLGHGCRDVLASATQVCASQARPPCPLCVSVCWPSDEGQTVTKNTLLQLPSGLVAVNMLLQLPDYMAVQHIIYLAVLS